MLPLFLCKTQWSNLNNNSEIKHEYLRSRASRCLLLSSSSSRDFWKFTETLTSWMSHPRIFKTKVVPPCLSVLLRFVSKEQATTCLCLCNRDRICQRLLLFLIILYFFKFLSLAPMAEKLFLIWSTHLEILYRVLKRRKHLFSKAFLKGPVP